MLQTKIGFVEVSCTPHVDGVGRPMICRSHEC